MDENLLCMVFSPTSIVRIEVIFILKSQVLSYDHLYEPKVFAFGHFLCFMYTLYALKNSHTSGVGFPYMNHLRSLLRMMGETIYQKYFLGKLSLVREMSTKTDILICVKLAAILMI